jgi:hypothetical protein
VITNPDKANDKYQLSIRHRAFWFTQVTPLRPFRRP